MKNDDKAVSETLICPELRRADATGRHDCSINFGYSNRCQVEQSSNDWRSQVFFFGSVHGFRVHGTSFVGVHGSPLSLDGRGWVLEPVMLGVVSGRTQWTWSGLIQKSSSDVRS